MLKVLDNKAEIQMAQTLFESKLNSRSDKQGIIDVGYRGESQRLNARWSKNLGIWWITEDSGNRFWNAFGTEEPRWNTGYSHSITCEINPPYQGINRQISGVFAKDPENRLYVLHRGRIGGGKPGIGKALFVREFRGSWEEAEDANEFTKFAVVASFDNPRFVEQISDFVHEVERIKSAPATVKIPVALEAIFKEEFYGPKKVSVTSSQTLANSDHGLIVNTLAKSLKGKGILVGNTQYVDLFILDSAGNPTALFEVKTDSGSTQVYEAIGQLYYHSAKLGAGCKLVAVFPSDVNQETKDTFRTLNIRLLTYRFPNGSLVFDSQPISVLS